MRRQKRKRRTRREYRSRVVERLDQRILPAVITVTSLADNLDADGQVTLREAIQAANDDASVDGSAAGNGVDEIVFAPGLTGVVTLDADLGRLEVTASLVITGRDANQTIIEAPETGVTVIAVPFSAETGTELTLDRLRLRSGANGVRFERVDGRLVINRSRIRNNRQGLFSNSDVRLFRTEIFSNGGLSSGGGLFVQSADVQIIESIIAENAVAAPRSGGGASIRDGSITIDRSTFHGNRSWGDGGGLDATDTHVQIISSTFSANETTGPGADGSAVAVTFRDDFSSSLTIERSTITDNHARQATDSAAVSMLRSEPSGSMPAVVLDSIIAGNTTIGANADWDQPAVVHSEFSHSLIGENTRTGLAANDGVPDADGNLVGSLAAPLDPGLLPLAKNGGPTPTHLPDSGSLAIDAGSLPQSSDTEQRGRLFARVAGSASDIGSVELSDTAFVVQPLTSVISETDATRMATFAVTLITDLAGPIQVRVETEDGTAVAPGDFRAMQTTLDFDGTAGQTREFTIEVFDDAEFESAEELFIRMEALVPGRPGLPLASVGIVSDETSGIGRSGNSVQLRTNGASDVVDVTVAGNDLVVDVNGTQTLFDRQLFTAINADLGNGNNRFTIESGLEIDATVLTGHGDDTVTTAEGDDSVSTRGGNDVVATFGGEDAVMSGSGNDVVTAGAGDDIVDAGSGSDNVSTASGRDFLFGRGGRDTLDGGQGRDHLFGGASGDVLIGGGGDDVLHGHTSEQGDPDFASAGPDLPNNIRGGDGDDRLFGPGNLRGEGGDDILAGSGMMQGGGGDDLLDVDDLTVSSRLIGGSGRDELNGSHMADTMIGGPGDDVINGRDGDDLIEGEEGDDTLDASSGDDTVTGGAGDDEIEAHNGNDRLFGGGGNDFLDGGAGIDVLDGGSGDDRLIGREGPDLLLGRAGSDRVEGDVGRRQRGRDLVVGGAGSDLVVGRGNQDILIGGTTSLTIDQLLTILDEWDSGRDLATRTANVRDGSGPGNRFNGDNFLVSAPGPAQTVFDDNEVDTANGGDDSDWFFINLVQDSHDDVDDDLFD